MKFKALFKSISRQVKKNASSGLTIGAMLGVPVTCYFVAKETPEAISKVESLPEDAGKAQKIGVTIAAYKKSIVSATLTESMIFGSHFLDHKEITALSALCASQATKNKEIKEFIGKDESLEMTKKKVEEKLHQPEYLENAIWTGHGTIACYDPLREDFFYSSKAYILKQVMDLNRDADRFKYDYIELCEFYDLMGLPCNEGLAYHFGFPYKENCETLDIGFEGGCTPEGIPYLILVYKNEPVYM